MLTSAAVALTAIALLRLCTACRAISPSAMGRGAPGDVPERAEAEAELVRAVGAVSDAVNSMFAGVLTPMEAVWSRGGDVTYMSPLGGRYAGWDDVKGMLKRTTGAFRRGRDEAEHILVRVDGDTGYAAFVERGVAVTSAGKSVSYDLRVTGVFRREEGEWKLVHYHSDRLKADVAV